MVAEEERAVSQAARAAWAKLIYRVYAADPLTCPRGGNEMRVIAVIHDAGVIRQILEHLKLLSPRPTVRGPLNESGIPDWPVNVRYWPKADLGCMIILDFIDNQGSWLSLANS